jgi:hypothetical protein
MQDASGGYAAPARPSRCTNCIKRDSTSCVRKLEVCRRLAQLNQFPIHIAAAATPVGAHLSPGLWTECTRQRKCEQHRLHETQDEDRRGVDAIGDLISRVSTSTRRTEGWQRAPLNEITVGWASVLLVWSAFRRHLRHKQWNCRGFTEILDVHARLTAALRSGTGAYVFCTWA